MSLHTASLKETKSNQVTDIYFRRAVQVLTVKNADAVVSAEFHCSQLPGGYQFAVFCGLEEVGEVLAGAPVDARAMREGSVFQAGEPVLRITGSYVAFAELETTTTPEPTNLPWSRWGRCCRSR